MHHVCPACSSCCGTTQVSSRFRIRSCFLPKLRNPYVCKRTLLIHIAYLVVTVFISKLCAVLMTPSNCMHAHKKHCVPGQQSTNLWCCLVQKICETVGSKPSCQAPASGSCVCFGEDKDNIPIEQDWAGNQGIIKVCSLLACCTTMIACIAFVLLAPRTLLHGLTE